MMPVRNEAWVLGFSARVALMWCDELVIRIHSSNDGSWEIVEGLVKEYAGRVMAIQGGESDWDEMAHRQNMLNSARLRGATHLAIIDADEVLTGDLVPHDRYYGIRGHALSALTEGEILQLPGYNVRNGISQYHSNGIWGNRWFSTAFRDDPRLGWTGDKFHSREPEGVPLTPYRPIAQGQGGVMHLWGASERRLRAKHAWYKVTERLRWPEKSSEVIDVMYSLAIKGITGDPAIGTPASWTYASVPASWWAPYQHLMRYLDVDAEPWQETEVRKLVAEHGKEKFQGLDLFGVA